MTSKWGLGRYGNQKGVGKEILGIQVLRLGGEMQGTENEE